MSQCEYYSLFMNEFVKALAKTMAVGAATMVCYPLYNTYFARRTKTVDIEIVNGLNLSENENDDESEGSYSDEDNSEVESESETLVDSLVLTHGDYGNYY